MTDSHNVRTRRADDRGMTLIEMLISLVIMGALFGVIAASVIFTTHRVSASKTTLETNNDSQFVLTYLNRDIASATTKTLDPTAQPDPAAPMPGTNVLQMSWTRQFAGVPTTTTVVAYRYRLDGASWVLERSEFRSDAAGDPLTLRSSEILAHDLPAPGAGWVEGAAAPTHALTLLLANPDAKGRQAVSLSMNFPGRTTPVVGGGQNFSSGIPVPARPAGEPWVQPVGSAGRCFGRVALILDTSGSVPESGGGFNLEQAAAGFIDGLADMSMSMSIIGFDRSAYQMYPGAATAFGSSFSLDDAAQRAAARDRITALDDQDNVYDYRDFPTADGIHWQQTAVPWVDPADGKTYLYDGGTNWEDALWHSIRDDNGDVLPAAELPTLAVFITDGQPNQVRPAVTGGVTGTEAVNRAKAAADAMRFLGVDLIAVGVGNSFTSGPASLNNLRTVVGSTGWNGSNPGNAAAADFFVGSFASLGQILTTITSSRCVAAAAFTPIADNGDYAAGEWGYWSAPTWLTSNAEYDPMVQFSFPMVGVPRRWVRVGSNAPPTSPGIAGVDCQQNGVALGADRMIVDIVDLSVAVELQVELNAAVSCQIREKP